MIEKLDRRLLMASIAVVNNILRIEGTGGNDRIEFALATNNQAKVFDNGTDAFTFTLGSVKGASFAGLAGDDVLILGRVPIRIYADGGTGADAMSASQLRFSDTMFGGDGNDYLFGGDGDDSLVGGAGQDGLFGDGGDDYIKILSDANGDDTVSGGPGFDSVDSTDYPSQMRQRIGDRTPAPLAVDDFIFEDVERFFCGGFDDNIAVVSGRPMIVFLGAGNDVFTGGSRADTVYGGAGNDNIFGAGGNDLFYDQDGSSVDTLNGGTGNDFAYVDSTDVLTDLEGSTLQAPPA